jgi:transposase
MARAYSDDLRRKLLEAHDRGQGTLSQLAQQFGVSRGWAWKISAQRKSNGQIERKQFTPGPKSRLDRAVLASIVASQPDATLPQIQAELERRSQLRLCTVYLWRVLGKMGFRLKKNRSTRLNAIPKPTASAVKSSSKHSVRSHLKR